MKKYFSYLLILSSLLYAKESFSYERADAFIINIFADKVKVLSPAKWDPKLNVIVYNKTLIRVVGKITTIEGNVLDIVSIKAGGDESYELKTPRNTRLFFVPMAPSFQKVELRLGNKPYEIPPKK